MCSGCGARRSPAAGTVEVDETFIGGEQPGLCGGRQPAKKAMVAVASLAKRWLLGTHQGAVDEAHLASYLNEFVFRFNRRRSRSRGLVFYRVLELAPPTSRRVRQLRLDGYPILL